MEYRNFGKSDLRVSAIGFGCWPMGGTQYGATDDAEEVAAVHRALDLGITCFDTAAGYGMGHSEELLGRALGKRRKDAVVVTKCGVAWNEETKIFERNGTRAHIMKSIDDSLRRLGGDYVDLYLIHWPDHKTPVAESMQALKDLIAAGKIRYGGVSNFQPDRLDEALNTLGIVTDQVGYNLFDRRVERNIIPFCRRAGIGVMAYGSLAHGLLTGTMTDSTQFAEGDWRSNGNAFGLPLFSNGHFRQNLEAVDELRAIAERAGKSLPHLASAWVLRDPVVTVSLIGFRRPAEVEAAVEAAGWKLSDALLKEIDAVSRKAFERLYAVQDLNPLKGPPNPENPYPPPVRAGAR